MAVLKISIVNSEYLFGTEKDGYINYVLCAMFFFGKFIGNLQQAKVRKMKQ